MLFWTLFTACTQESGSTDPAIGNIQLCIAEDLRPSMETEEPMFVTGDLVNIRESSGDCAAELVFQVEDREHIIGYSILDPEGNDATFIPEWNAVEEVTLSTHISFVFGMSYGLILEDSNGILMALDEGAWGGALRDATLPFEVGQSENALSSNQGECITATGYALTIGEEEMAPFGEYDLDIDGQGFTFIAVAAVEYGPGTSCEISDMSDIFSWALFRD